MLNPPEPIEPNVEFIEGCLAEQSAKPFAEGDYASAIVMGTRVVVVYMHEGDTWFIASNDNARTWALPERFCDIIETPTEGCRFARTCAIHIGADYKAVVVCPEGVFISITAGATWKHYPEAASAAQLDGPVLVPGSRIVEHPNFGLVIAGHVEDSTDETIYLRTSPDGGETWFDFHQDLPKGTQLAHPSLLSVRGSMLMLAPNLNGFDKKTKSWHYNQLHSEHGRLPFESLTSSLSAPDAKKVNKNFGPLAMDVPALMWNAETQRVEAVIAARAGGTKEALEGSGMSLDLWSIPLSDWLAGKTEWQHEKCLAAVPKSAAKGAGGFAATVAVSDGDNTVRHLFFHGGPEKTPVLYHAILPVTFGE